MKTKNIGAGITPPENKCEDNKCPFHGKIKVRGRIFVGTVIAAKMQRTATIEWTRRIIIPKYERYARKKTKLKAHNPDCIKAEDGEIVKIMECTPISKTVNFVIVEKLGKEKGFIQKKEALESSKKPASEKIESKEVEKEESQEDNKSVV
ncbi:MAG: 30S ribosomal protein S17 [Nanoarchaeota archaeon]|nr:30S ribosomal protein S17 [Nanoarchaeota archaeon]